MKKTQGWKIAKKRGKKQNRIPPFAPSSGEVKFYISIIKKVAKDKKLPKRALVLGATPELRDGAIKNGFETHAVDLSKKIMDKFSALMKYKGHKQDRRVIKNWLKMTYPKDHFGLVLADASLNNLATKKENEKLVSILRDITVPNGYLVLRQVVWPTNYKSFGDFRKLTSLYRRKKISWADFFCELRFYTFRKQVYNKKTYQYDVGKNFKLIKQLFKQGFLTKKEYQKINTFRNNVINTIYPEKFFIKIVEKRRFRLIKTFQDKPDRFFKFLHLFVFQKQ